MPHADPKVRRAYQREWAKWKRAKPIAAADLALMDHGRISTYAKGCRCEQCVAKNRERSARQLTSRQRHRMFPYSFVHGLDGYDNHDCRCGVCRAAYNAKYRAAQIPTLDAAIRRGQEWTGLELDLVARRDLTAKQVAEMTRRTFAAVKSARHRIASDDPRTMQILGTRRQDD